MRIKQTAADFQVDELSHIAPAADGRHAVYRLTKTDTPTFEALSTAGHLLGVPRHRIAFGGLKDARAVTRQPVSVDGGPETSAEHGGVRIDYLGRSDRPVDRESFSANRFAMVVRDMDDEEAMRLIDRVRRTAEAGLPNYFDDQRFGSLRGEGEFVGRLLVEGRFEEALRRMLAETRRKDRQAFKKRRRRVQELWGRWRELVDELPPCPERAAAERLADCPDDFAGAFERIPHEKRTLAMGVWQAYLWNETLRRLIERGADASSLRHVDYRAGRMVFDDAMPPERAWALSATEISMPHGRMPLGDDEVSRCWRATFEAEGVSPEDLELPALPKTKPHRNLRRALVAPTGLAIEGPFDDELNEGRRAVALEFDLPRASYATLLVKS